MSTTPYCSVVQETDWWHPLPGEPPEHKKGLWEVSKEPPHKIYWHEYGNPDGEPVMFIHGGPGGGTERKEARFFDPDRYRIILFDQRGCGKSEPSAADDSVAALKNNTTADMIADIESLRDHLEIKGKMHVFGGSWGSTLAMAYAMEHPDHVQSLIIRGIFLCRKKDLDYFYQGNAENYHNAPYDISVPGTYIKYSTAWKNFVEAIPDVEDRKDMIRAYAKIFAMTPKDDVEREFQDRAATAWSMWEGITSYVAADEASLKEFAKPQFAKAFAKIENHYFLNGGFLGGSGEANRDNNYILENVGKIAHLPIHIIQGQFDEVCPINQADELVAALKKHGAKDIEYIITPAGHSSMEAHNARALTDVMDRLPPMNTLDKILPPRHREATFVGQYI